MSMSTTFDDEATKKPLKVLIAGAGLAGLATAIALRRQGHDVEIFEASKFANEVGAAITIPPNSARLLQGLGVDVHRMGGVEWKGITIYLYDDTVGKEVVTPAASGEFPYGFMVHRVDYHNVLKETALSEEGEGKPVKLHLQNGVQSCDTEQGIITLKNGETRQGDIVIGADGIRSTIRTSVLGKVHVAPSSHIAAFRWLVDSSKFKDDPEFSWVLGEGPQGPRMISKAQGGRRSIFAYPCRNGDLFNVTMAFSDPRDQDAVEWTVPTTLDLILEKYSDFNPKFIKFLKLAENPKIWQMRSLGPLSTWINRRTCLAGDAAHSMMPTLGQGAAQAVEDAITLGVVLPKETKREEVPHRLELFQQARKERAEFIQKYSIDQLFSDETRFSTALADMVKVQAQVVRHDALKHAQEILDKDVTSKS